jgi:hypothetical protein
MQKYTVECITVVGDAQDRRSVLLVSTNDNRDSHLSEVLSYEVEDGPSVTVFAEDILCTDMWKSRDGRHFLCDNLGSCHWQQDDGSFVQRPVTDRVLYAIWGLHERAVYAIGEKGTCLRFDGSDWIDMSEGLEGYVHAISGTAENDLCAVGDNGLFAHWNGVSWKRIDLGTNVDWRALEITPTGQIYICGLGGTFACYSDGEILFSGKVDGSLLAIKTFLGETYFGSPSLGTFRLEGQELVLVKENVKASALSATQRRLYAAVGARGVWFDGTQWRAALYAKP